MCAEPTAHAVEMAEMAPPDDGAAGSADEDEIGNAWEARESRRGAADGCRCSERSEVAAEAASCSWDIAVVVEAAAVEICIRACLESLFGCSFWIIGLI